MRPKSLNEPLPPSPHRGFLSIGAFSRATRLSQKALRLYDTQNILRPAYTDAQTGYRYYKAVQIGQAKLIAELRRLNVPLALVRKLLTLPSPEAADVFEWWWKTVENRVQEQKPLAQSVAKRLCAPLEEPSMNEPVPPVTTKTVPPQLIVSITRRVFVTELEHHLTDSYARLQAFIASQAGAEPDGEAFYHGPVNNEDQSPVEVCLPVRGAVLPSGDIVAREIPGGNRAVIVGPPPFTDFPRVLELYDAVAEWVMKNGHTMNGSPLEFSPAVGLKENVIRVEWFFE